MGKLVSDHFLEKVLPVVEDVPEAPASLQARVYAAIDDKRSSASFRARTGRKALRCILDAPPAILASVAALVLVFTPLLVYRAMSAPTLGLAVRSFKKATRGDDTAFALGSLLKGEEILRTEANGHLTASKGDAMILHLFEKSEVRLRESKKILGIHLEKGALYVSRRKPSPGREPRIFIFDQVISLVGTTLYVEKTEPEGYRLICQEGLLEVEESKRPGAVIARIAAGMYVDMASDARVLANGRLESLPGGYSAMFDAMKALSFVSGGKLSSVTVPYRIERETSQAASAQPTSVTDPEKPKYAIEAMGRLDSFKPDVAQRTFAKEFSVDGKIYAELYDGIYRISPKEFKKIVSFSRTPAAAPLLVSGDVLQFFQDGLTEYSKSFEKQRDIPYPKKGSIQNGYLPVLSDGCALVPLQGGGLYRFLTENGTFAIIDENVFPSTPIAFEKGFLMGTYYRNSYARLDAEHNRRWEYKLPGRSYVDPIALGDETYFYCEDDAGQKIIMLDGAGKAIKEITLPEPVVSDMATYAEGLLMVSSKGGLIKMDRRTGKASVVKRLYDRTLSSGEWRSLSLTIDSGRLITLASKGELEVFSLASMKSLLKVNISSDAAFEMQPIAIGNRFYAIDEKGGVFAVDWLED
jgi:outer membrane protein assembly factor BamB